MPFALEADEDVESEDAESEDAESEDADESAGPDEADEADEADDMVRCAGRQRGTCSRRACGPAR